MLKQRINNPIYTYKNLCLLRNEIDGKLLQRDTTLQRNTSNIILLTIKTTNVCSHKSGN